MMRHHFFYYLYMFNLPCSLFFCLRVIVSCGAILVFVCCHGYKSGATPTVTVCVRILENRYYVIKLQPGFHCGAVDILARWASGFDSRALYWSHRQADWYTVYRWPGCGSLAAAVRLRCHNDATAAGKLWQCGAAGICPGPAHSGRVYM